MARNIVETNQRLQIRLSPAEKARIARAAAIRQVDLTQFVPKRRFAKLMRSSNGKTTSN